MAVLIPSRIPTTIADDARAAKQLDPRQWNPMQQAIKEVCADGAVRYVDLLSAPQFTIGDFSDPDHLNADGSKKRSLLLDSMMVQW